MKAMPVIVILSILCIIVSCGQQSANNASAPAGEVSRTDLGYAIGVSIGSSLKQFDFDFDYDAFLNGVKDECQKKTPRITPEEAEQMIQTAMTRISEKKNVENLAKEKAFLDQNKSKKGVITTASGLQYEVIKEGAGKKPTQESLMTLNYKGTLLDGTEFDSSYKRGEPAVFATAGVIPGFGEGLMLMSPGSTYKFYIPSALAYGPRGQQGIPPGSLLIFEVELISFKN